MTRGQIWWCHFEAPDKRRPVVVLTRSAVVPYLTQLTVAPITSRIRGLPTEVAVGPRQGLAVASVVNLDLVQTVAKPRLTEQIGVLDEPQLRQVCVALGLALGCAAA